MTHPHGSASGQHIFSMMASLVRSVAAVAFTVMLLAGVLVTAAHGEGGGCPNEALRTGESAALPSCRAYEQVSPPGAEPEFLFAEATETGDPQGGNGQAPGLQVSMSGDRLGYVTNYPPSGSPSDGRYLRVTRGPSGWSSEEMIPPQSTDYGILCPSGYVAAYSSELTDYVLADGVGQPGSDISEEDMECGTDDPRLVSGEPEGFQNLFEAEGESGPYQLVDEIDHAPEPFSNAGAWFEAASEDLSHVVFVEAARLTPEAPAVSQTAELSKGAPPFPDLYEWANGSVRLVTILPDGTPVPGTLGNGFLPVDDVFNGGAATFTHAVSANGSHVFFQASGDLYLRVNAEQPQSPINGEGACSQPAAGCTIQVEGPPGGAESGGGAFAWATPDGSRVFFLDERQLTSNSNAKSGSPDLYEYDLGAASGERLRDLTPSVKTEPADVQGVSGVSDDGAYVYFVADAKLVEDGPEPGKPNLYLAHSGTLTFIATLEPSAGGGVNLDEPDWKATEMTSRVTPDGQFLAFNSVRPLTGYDNVDAASHERDNEIFLFDAATGSLACVSCSPTDAPSTAFAKIQSPSRAEVGLDGESAGYLQRNLTDDGRVFFSTAEQLAGATDGRANVYEYDAGALHLISTGKSGDPSYFYDASADGSDVFFVTSQNLPSGEAAHEFRVYDAREDGGFSQSQGPEEACTGEACRSEAGSLGGLSTPPTQESLPSGNAPAPTPASEAKNGKGSTPPKSAAQIRREQLARALARCRKQRAPRKRAACETQARHRYGAKKAAPKKAARRAER
jgi:hypothetical protein